MPCYHRCGRIFLHIFYQDVFSYLFSYLFRTFPFFIGIFSHLFAVKHGYHINLPRRRCGRAPCRCIVSWNNGRMRNASPRWGSAPVDGFRNPGIHRLRSEVGSFFPLFTGFPKHPRWLFGIYPIILQGFLLHPSGGWLIGFLPLTVSSQFGGEPAFWGEATSIGYPWFWYLVDMHLKMGIPQVLDLELGFDVFCRLIYVSDLQVPLRRRILHRDLLILGRVFFGQLLRVNWEYHWVFPSWNTQGGQCWSVHTVRITFRNRIPLIGKQPCLVWI